MSFPEDDLIGDGYWATDENYTSGPFINEPNKAAPSSGDIAQGFVPGTPIRPEVINYILNNFSQHISYNNQLITTEKDDREQSDNDLQNQIDQKITVASATYNVDLQLASQDEYFSLSNYAAHSDYPIVDGGKGFSIPAGKHYISAQTVLVRSSTNPSVDMGFNIEFDNQVVVCGTRNTRWSDSASDYVFCSSSGIVLVTSPSILRMVCKFTGSGNMSKSPLFGASYSRLNVMRISA